MLALRRAVPMSRSPEIDERGLTLRMHYLEYPLRSVIECQAEVVVVLAGQAVERAREAPDR